MSDKPVMFLNFDISTKEGAHNAFWADAEELAQCRCKAVWIRRSNYIRWVDEDGTDHHHCLSCCSTTPPESP
jgi:hypothetical protein